jgi:hypothetical protein
MIKSHSVLEDNKIIDFSGTIQYETIGELIHLFKNQVHSLGVHTGTYKKILLVMIESLENMMKYSECPVISAEPGKTFFPDFSIRKDLNQYIIASSNPMQKQNISSLERKLNHLNTMNQQDLKNFYKETITNGQFTEYGGAGLGLIEMAKISGKRMEFQFLPIDDLYARFSLMVTIDECPS